MRGIHQPSCTKCGAECEQIGHDYCKKHMPKEYVMFVQGGFKFIISEETYRKIHRHLGDPRPVEFETINTKLTTEILASKIVGFQELLTNQPNE